ncbi:MAG: biopolymer transporter ExbD [Deltaproteobacteria bacterium]|nr:biopolymer transporter ExbD [Deltaproteobacteria bacterium]
MQVGSTGGLQSDLNVTPMIDVVLVLLIIFMVVTPKNDRELPVVVPEEVTAPDQQPPPGDEPLVVEVDEAGALRFAGEPVPDLVELRLRVTEAVLARKEKVVFLEAHDDAPYDTCVKAMDAARKGGARHVGLISPQPVVAVPGAPPSPAPAP